MPQLGEEVFVTPRPGLVVADAHGRPLQAGLVRWSENWQRRLEAGDVEVISPMQVEEPPLPPIVRAETGPISMLISGRTLVAEMQRTNATPKVELREDPGSGAPAEVIR